jgi:hypothetical protein
MTTPDDHRDDTFEHEKWEAEKAFREREVVIKERDLDAREAEIDLKRKEHAVSQWSNPLIVAILAASIAAISSTAVALVNGIYSRQVDRQRSEEERILEMIKTGNADKAAENLRFLLSAGLITDPSTRSSLETFLNKRKAGSGPVLPTTSADAAARVSQKLEDFLHVQGVVGENVTITPTPLSPEQIRELQKRLDSIQNEKHDAN